MSKNKTKRVNVVEALGGRDWLRAAGLKLDPAGVGLSNGAAFEVIRPQGDRPNKAVVTVMEKTNAFRVEYFRVAEGKGNDEAESMGESLSAAVAGLKSSLVKRMGLVIDPIFLPFNPPVPTDPAPSPTPVAA